jgi:uncharacterized protein YccT (UPF0319 family)
MLTSQAANSLTIVNLVTTEGEIANTAAATSAWTLLENYSGHVVVFQDVGTISSGTLIGTVETATDDQGAGSATVATFTTVTTSDDAPSNLKVVLPATIGKYVRYVGTLSAGTGDISVTLVGSKQLVG